jgi:hypothetical protein
MTATRFFSALFLVCVLSSCGTETEKCAIDCENVLQPGSRQLFSDYLSCGDCQARFRSMRASVCGAESTAACCVCTYVCEAGETHP